MMITLRIIFFQVETDDMGGLSNLCPEVFAAWANAIRDENIEKSVTIKNLLTNLQLFIVLGHHLSHM